MLVLGRKLQEAILLDGGKIRVSILEVHGNRVKLGIEAPRDVVVQRETPGECRPMERRLTLAE